jgi:hypothetical protein
MQVFSRKKEPRMTDYAPKRPNNGGEPRKKLTVSEAIAESCNEVADRLEVAGTEIMQQCTTLIEELTVTAGNLRQVGDLECRRASALYQRMQGTIDTIKEIRETFAAPLLEASNLNPEHDATVTAGLTNALALPPASSDETPSKATV